MLSLAVNLIFIFVIVILSILLTRPRAACPDHWVGYWEKCYYFSEPRDEWSDSQDQCSAFGASLAGIDTWQEMDFLVHYKGSFGHWISLRRELGQAWKWANGTKFNHWFPIAGEEQCAFLSHNNVASSGCPNCQPWICSKPA